MNINQLVQRILFVQHSTLKTRDHQFPKTFFTYFTSYNMKQPPSQQRSFKDIPSYFVTITSF